MFVWLDGDILPAAEARISVFDRGFLFGDGVYEVVRTFDGIAPRLPQHAQRLRSSLALARITGFDCDSLATIVPKLLHAESLDDATIYVQVTRGATNDRRHLPQPGLPPTVVAFASAAPGIDRIGVPSTCRAVVLPDDRWLGCAIKSTSLLGNVLGVMMADDLHADEAILARPRGAPSVDRLRPDDDDLVGEGATSSVWAVVDDILVTPPVDSFPPILHGITRAAALDAAARLGLRVDIRPLSVRELRESNEIFITSARRLIASVITLDQQPVGPPTPGTPGTSGIPGPRASALATAMRDDVARAVDAIRRHGADATSPTPPAESTRAMTP